MLSEKAWYNLSPQKTYELYVRLIQDIGKLQHDLDEAEEHIIELQPLIKRQV